MAFVAWAALCLVTITVLQRRPFVLVVLILLIWVGIPGIAAYRVTAIGDLPALHPAAVLAILTLVVLLVTRPAWVGRAVLDRPEWVVLLATVSAIAIGVGLLAGAGPPSVVAVVNQMLGPGIVFVLVGSSLLERPERAQTLRRLVIGLAVAESCLALVQLVLDRPLVYAEDFADLAIVRQGSGRWMGTLDHPLVLSLLLVVALLLLVGVSSGLVVGVAAPLILAGVLATQSRVGLLFAVLAVITLLVRGRVRFSARMAALGLVVAIGLYAYALGAVDALQERLRDDQGSSTARGRALEYFVDHVDEFLWFGRGLNGSFSVSEAAGLDSSFESAILMYAIDVGLAVAVVYFALMAWIAVRPLRRSGVPGTATAAISVVLIPQTFSALSGTTAAPLIVWLVLAIAGFCPLYRPTGTVSPSLAVDLTRSHTRSPVLG